MTEIEITNLALRGLNEPAVATLADSPLATIARDRCTEFSNRIQSMGPWNFSQASYKIATTINGSSNRKPWQAHEEVVESTSSASLTLIAADRKTLWLRLDTGTATGGQLLTGQTSGAIRLGGALGAALDPDDSWAFADLPDLLAVWIGKEAALDLQREFKLGQLDMAVLREEVLRARGEFMEWDEMWGGTNANDMPSVSGPRDEFNAWNDEDDQDA